MPEHVSRLDTGLPSFPAGAEKGAIFSPLPQDTKDGEMRAHAVQTVLSDPQTLYALWRDVSKAPLWQEFVASVEVKSKTQSHWVFGDPGDPSGKRIEYDVEIVEDVPGEKIAWRSVDSKFDEHGEVLFKTAAGDRGTVVVLKESVHVPGGKLSIALAGAAKRTPRQIVIEDLRHFKQLAETGEIPTVAKNPHGPRGAVGAIKKRIYGENNPTPSATSVLDKAS